MKYHPYADLFPLLEGTEFLGLVADIKENGLHHPITVFEDMILDGRNRERACVEASVTPTYEPLPKGKDPLRFVASRNIHRRHLTKVQCSFISAQMANMKVGDNQHAENRVRKITEPLISQSGAAKLMGVSTSYVEKAKAVLDSGDTDLIEKTKAGKVSLVDAVTQVKTGVPAPEKKKQSGHRAKPRKPAPKFDEGTKFVNATLEETGETPSRAAVQEHLGGAASGTADAVIAGGKGYRRGYEDGLNAAAANPALLGATFSAKYERALKSMDRIVDERIEAGVRAGVEEGVKRVVEKYWLPEEKMRIMRLEGLMNRKTPFTYDEYRQLLAALHPDKPEGEDRVAAFQMVKERGPILRPIQKEEEPPPFRIRTHEEFLAEKARRAAEAKKKRAA